MSAMLDHLTITDPRAAAVFSGTQSRGLVFALMKSEQSLRDLTDISGMSLSLLHYHIQKFLRLGLAQKVGSRIRPGRPISLYRATAASFTVPAALMASTPGASLRDEMETLLDNASVMQGVDATLFLLDDNRNPKMRRIRGNSATTATGEKWWRLALSDRDASELSDRIVTLVTSYADRQTGAERNYLCNFALAKSRRRRSANRRGVSG